MAAYHKTGLSVVGQPPVLYIQAEHNTDTPKLQDDFCRVQRAKADLFDKPDGMLQYNHYSTSITEKTCELIQKSR